MALAPNTGEATKMAPFSPRRSEHFAHVSGEDNVRACEEALKSLLGDAASLFEGLTPGHCAVVIVKWWQALGGKVLLKVQGHAKAHGTEAKL
ncbi:hypothetical protein VM1G_12029 [Cytospora mali]|uniref:Uncharacterized protein n=1 Tax=Cytospora mali TaxID=578113 RepID=A0A194VI76_CYTMA|nr:hypothetical protein VM1G_12029 [Valsa mali]